MATKRFFVPFPENDPDPMKNQILKNSGYFSITLFSVQYRAKGNFWQGLFGGKNDVALVSSVSYDTTEQSIVAKSIQDNRTIKVKKDDTIPFGISKPVALIVPTISDAVELSVTLTIVRKDNLGETLNMLNSDEFKKPLQLAPPAVGEILGITNMVKKLFTDTSPQDETKATYAGLIHMQPDLNPVDKQCLVSGYVIAISNDDPNDPDFKKITDSSKFVIKQNSIEYDGKEVKETCMIYSITYQSVRGRDEGSSWFKKFQKEAIDKLDELFTASTDDEKIAIRKSAFTALHDSFVLLSDDSNFISSEREGIKANLQMQLQEKYDRLANQHGLVSMLNIAKNIEVHPSEAWVAEIMHNTKEVKKISDNYMIELEKNNIA